jgi:hypothetical protein
VESFNSRVRDELLAVEVFTCLAEAKVMVEDFRQDYNRSRPHRAHGMMTPTAFATGWRSAHEAARASARVAGTVARPGSHGTVRTLVVYGSSGRRVMTPAAGRFVDLESSP